MLPLRVAHHPVIDESLDLVFQAPGRSEGLADEVFVQPLLGKVLGRLSCFHRESVVARLIAGVVESIVVCQEKLNIPHT